MSSTIDAARLVHRQAGADRGGHRLLDQVHARGAGGLRRLLDRAALDRGRAVRHADQHAGVEGPAVAPHLLDEVLEHVLGDAEVGDHAVLERTDGGDVAGRAAEHALGVVADRLDHLVAARLLADRDDRRLVEHDAATADVDQRVGGPEVDRDVVGEEAAQGVEHGVL
jgi:hypothetical protein